MSTASTQQTKADRIAYPIGAKLIIIITVLLLLSLGAITLLVSALVSQDVRITAEDNNFTVNRRSATEAENILSTIRANTLILLDTLSAIGNSPALAQDIGNFFFEGNSDIAFVGSARNSASGVYVSRRLANQRFFLANELESSTASDFILARAGEVRRSIAGETLLLNASPAFGVPTLCLLIPRQEAGEPEAVAVFFSSNPITESFAGGANLSYMVNDAGDYLVHADSELIRAGAGAAASPMVAMMLESTVQGRQSLYEDADGTQHFGAYRRLSLVNAAVITTIPYDVVFEGIAATTRRNIYLTGAVLFLAVLFVWFFSKSVSVPLKTLAAAAQQIEGGNFELDLKPKTRDEVGYLSNSFQRMSNALGIFGRFTNKEIALRAMRGEIKPGGLPRHATVFFSDIRNFTQKSENFTTMFGDQASDRIVAWLNFYFTRMVECVEKTNGVVDKFIGDAVMAHWGTAYTAGSPEKDAYNSIVCALMMRSALQQMNRDRRAEDASNPPIRIGCSINSGIVTAGQLGSEQRMDYTVIGDPVNLASRIEALNKPLATDILISEETWKLAGERFLCEEMPSFTIRGKEKPVRVFAVINLRDAKGPQTLAEVRKILGVEAPDMALVDVEAEEQKYKIGAGE